MKAIIALTTGDPFGIGPEISLRAACSPEVRGVCRPLLIGDRARLLQVARELPGLIGDDPAAWPVLDRPEPGQRSADGGLAGGGALWEEGPAICDLADLGGGTGPAAPSAEGGRASILYVEAAAKLARSGAAAAVVTAPLSKRALRLAGRDAPGHTELLADLCGIDREGVAMMFVTAELKVALLTTHLGLREAIAAIASDRVEQRLKLVRSEHRRWFGDDPRIALCALNPHAGEGGLYGSEEEEILMPALESARRAGVRATGPWPADTVYTRAARGEFDVVLALFHDQATIAVKSRSFGHAVNLTLGLPFLRASVDHGTAYDIAGRGVADPSSLVEALLLAARLTGLARSGMPAGRSSAWQGGAEGSRR
ncbi:MAG: 4-hydroxythreonine-4-phosphate dehydrogenase PdxA [Acidobacteriota bacterium]